MRNVTKLRVEWFKAEGKDGLGAYIVLRRQSESAEP